MKSSDNSNPNSKTINKKHGMTKTKVYRAWINIKIRCLDKDCKFFEHYGGRGITIHPDWEHDFEAFYREIGDPPTSKHSVDRVDNEKGYEPGNVRWVTQKEQMNNTRRNVPVTINGVTKNLCQWITELGVSKQTVMYRMREGWTPQDALTVPKGERRKRATLATIDGKTKSIAEWIRELGISKQTVFYRMRGGWTAEDALITPRFERTGVKITLDGKTQSLSKWLKEKGINKPTYYYRVNSGMTPEEAITKPVGKYNKRA